MEVIRSKVLGSFIHALSTKQVDFEDLLHAQKMVCEEMRGTSPDLRESAVHCVIRDILVNRFIAT